MILVRLNVGKKIIHTEVLIHFVIVIVIVQLCIIKDFLQKREKQKENWEKADQYFKAPDGV